MSKIGDSINKAVFKQNNEQNIKSKIIEDIKNKVNNFQSEEEMDNFINEYLGGHERRLKNLVQANEDIEDIKNSLRKNIRKTKDDDVNKKVDQIKKLRTQAKRLSNIDDPSKISDVEIEQYVKESQDTRSYLKQKHRNTTDKKLKKEIEKLIQENDKVNDLLSKIKSRAKTKQDINKSSKKYKEKTGRDLEQDTKDVEESKQNDKIASKTKAKAAAITAVIDNVFKALTDSVKWYYGIQMSLEREAFDVRMGRLDAIQKITNSQLDVVEGRLKRTFSVGLQAYNEGGVNESAYAAANNAIDNVVEQTKFKMEKDLTEQRQRHQEVIRRQQGSLERTQSTTSWALGLAGAVAGVALAVFTGGLAAPIIASVVTGGAGLAAEWYLKATELENLRFKQYAELTDKEKEIQNGYIEKGMKIAQEMSKSINDFVKGVEKFYLANEKIYFEVGRNMGISGSANIANYNDMLMRLQSQFAWIGGKESAQKYAKMLSGSNETSGYNVALTGSDIEKGLSLGYLIGDDNANSITTTLSLFNKSVADGSDILFEMYKNANKVGLNTRKYAKDLAESLKMAQKYTFRDGVRGIMEMSLWAQRVRFNIQALSGVLDKMIGGGLEGVIKQSAQLQVLGGSAAINSNPLAMAYEMLNDPEALAKRLYNMTDGIGMFNKKTGQAEIRGADLLKVRAIAEAQGRSETDIRNEIEQRLKVSEIDKIISNRYNEEQKNLIYSKARYDTETNQWKVAINRNGELQNVNINELSNEEFVELKNTEEQLVDYVKDIRDSLLKTEGTEQTGMSNLQAATGASIRGQVNQRVANTQQHYSDNFEALSGTIQEVSEFFTKSQEQEFKKFGSTANIAKRYNEFMLKESAKQTELLEGDVAIASKVLDYMQGIPGSLDAIHRAVFGMTQEERNLFAQTLAANDSKIAKLFEDEEELAKYSQLVDLINTGQSKSDDASKLFSHFKDQGISFDSVALYAQFDEFLRYKGIYSKTFNSPFQTNDSFMSGNNRSMMTAASKVVPINDGSVSMVQSHPLDSAIFAKVGGPFDTLFKGVFGQVNAIYELLSGKGSGNINVNFGGKIELSSNGQSIDIMTELKSNPQLVRTLTERIITQIGQNRDGGKTLFNRNRYAYAD